jgi:uncharacterized protein
MKALRIGALLAVLASGFAARAQQIGQPQLKIDSSNRTLTVTATDRITVDPDLAILHIGFETQPGDARSAYADGARASNSILAAVKQAGIADSEIRSESQYLSPDPMTKSHKYRLTQRWTVRVPPGRAAEILDAAVDAGATTSGQIEWTVKDESALEEQALDKAAARARENAAVLAKGMGVRLGNLIYVTNQMASPVFPRPMTAMRAMGGEAPPQQPLAIEPGKVVREATVNAVFAIE